ncbi:MAG: hypothetical protein ACREJD_09495 [Phycisphaerales bacterium]
MKYRIAFMIVQEKRLMSSLLYSPKGRTYDLVEPAIRDAEKQNALVKSLEYVVIGDGSLDILWQKAGSRVPPNMRAREIQEIERASA